VSTFTLLKDALAKGPGTLFWTTPGVTAPVNTVAGNVFTVNTWPSWFQLAITMGGSEWRYDVKQEPIQAEEYLDDIDQADVGREAGVQFELMRINATNMARALNRPTPVVTGSPGGTLLTEISPPDLGGALYCQIGWQGTDDTERIIATNCLMIGSLKVNRRKGAKVATLALDYKFFPDASTGKPYKHFFAGDIRA
jgi:hypothetical protein